MGKIKGFKKSNICYVFIVCVIVLSTLYAYTIEKKYIVRKSGVVHPVKFQGEFQLQEGGTVYPLERCEKINCNENKKIIFKGHIKNGLEKNRKLIMGLVRVSVKIYKNGELIYKYGQKDSIPKFAHSAGDKWVYFIPGEIKETDEIKIVLENRLKRNDGDAYQTFLNELCTGDCIELYAAELRQSFLFKSVFVMVLILGTIILLVSSILKMMKQKVVSFIPNGALFMIVSGAWMQIEHEQSSLVFTAQITSCIFETSLFLLLLPTLVRYCRSFMRSRLEKISIIIEYMGLGLVILYLILQFWGRVDGIDFQKAYYIGFMLPCAILQVGCMLYELFQNHSRKLFRLLVSLVVSSCFIGIGIISLYKGVFAEEYIAWLGREKMMDGDVLQEVGYAYLMHRTVGIGILIFIFVQIVEVIIYTKENLAKAEQTKNMEEKLKKNEIAMMMTQIQPHFLYNALSSIRQLCEKDSVKASKALDEFSKFLRGNLDSLGSLEPIFFEQELAHVENYLALEKIRYEDKLKLKYEIEVNDFRIPALVLQPIVENAVKYGIKQRPEGGTITIASKEENDVYVISVTDDGAGFDVKEKKQDGRSHVGIENVKFRIEQQCNGTLKIYSVKGKGTRVEMRIPK